jgi:hypothetical protein
VATPRPRASPVDHVSQLDGRGLTVDSGSERDAEDAAFAVDDRERLARAVGTPVFVSGEPALEEVGRGRVGRAREADDLRVVTHRRETVKIGALEWNDPDVGRDRRHR